MIQMRGITGRKGRVIDVSCRKEARGADSEEGDTWVDGGGSIDHFRRKKECTPNASFNESWEFRLVHHLKIVELFVGRAVPCAALAFKRNIIIMPESVNPYP